MFSQRDASRILKQLGIKGVSAETLAQGMNVEFEHRAITHGDPMMTARIALDHLAERPDYYDLLDKMERAPVSVFAPGASLFKHDGPKDFTSDKPAITRLIVEKGEKKIQVDYAVQGYILLKANKLSVVNNESIYTIYKNFEELTRDSKIAGCAAILEDAACKQKCTTDMMRLLSLTAWTGYTPWWWSIGNNGWREVNEYLRFDKSGVYKFNIQMPSGYTPFEWGAEPKRPSKLLSPQLISWRVIG